MQKEFLRVEREAGRVKFRIRTVLSEWRGRTSAPKLEEGASKK